MKNPRLNVYVVDDEAPVRDALARLLVMESYPVQVFASGQAFLAQAPLDGHGVVLLDLEMDEDRAAGIKVVDQLQQRRSPLVVVFLSGKGRVRDVAQVMRGGAALDWLEKPPENDWLQKPTDPGMLLDTVVKAYSKARARSEGWALWATLTKAERELVPYLVTDLTARDIGNILGKDHRTVETQRSAVYNKLKVDGPGQLRQFLIDHDIPDASKRRYGCDSPKP